MHGHSFERMWTKFGSWHPYSPGGHGPVSECRSRPQARAARAVYTPLQMSGERRLEIRN